MVTKPINRPRAITLKRSSSIRISLSPGRDSPSFAAFFTSTRLIQTRTVPGAVKEAADRAMALASEAGESWIAQGAYRYRVLRDFEGAVTAYKQAQIRLPNNSYLLQNLAFVQRRLGLWQEAEATFKKALELDPRDFQLLGSLGGELYAY